MRSRHRRQRIANLVRDAGGHLAYRRQPLLNPRLALLTPDFRDVLEREDEPDLAARRRQDRGADAELDLPAVAALERIFDARQLRPRLRLARPPLHRSARFAGTEHVGELARQLQDLGGVTLDRRRRRDAGDRRRGPVEAQDPAVDVGRRQAAGQAAMTCWPNAWRVGDLVRRLLERRAGPPQALGEVAAQRRHRHEAEDVQADDEEPDPPRRQQVAAERRSAPPACPRTAPATMPLYIRELSTPTIMPLRRDWIVLAAMIGSA